MDTRLGGRSPAPGTVKDSGGSRPVGLGGSQKQGQLSGWVVTARTGGAATLRAGRAGPPSISLWWGHRRRGPPGFPAARPCRPGRELWSLTQDKQAEQTAGAPYAV